jgi:hypothetical protein
MRRVSPSFDQPNKLYRLVQLPATERLALGGCASLPTGQLTPGRAVRPGDGVWLLAEGHGPQFVDGVARNKGALSFATSGFDEN